MTIYDSKEEFNETESVEKFEQLLWVQVGNKGFSVLFFSEKSHHREVYAVLTFIVGEGPQKKATFLTYNKNLTLKPKYPT